MLIGSLGGAAPDPAKSSPYECGFRAFRDARMKFDVRYYLVVAILFILFDLGNRLFYFLGRLCLKLACSVLSMLVFLAILVVGFVYEWKKGALEWE